MTDELQTLIAETLEIMSLLDRTEEEGDCILWTGATGPSGRPIYKPTGGDCMAVHRAIFALSGEKLIPRRPVDNTCDEKRCINPAHLFQSTAAKVAKKAGERGAWSGLVRRSRISAAKREGSKLTDDMVQEIRCSDESGPVLALRYGVNKDYINRIKNGNARRDYTPSPWAGLGGRAA